MEQALSIVAAHPEVALPLVGLVEFETWVMASVLMMENAAANMADVELVLSIVVAHPRGTHPGGNLIDPLVQLGVLLAASVPMRGNVAANMAGVELVMRNPEGAFPLVGLVVVETWVMASVLIIGNAAANMAGAELALSTALNVKID